MVPNKNISTQTPNGQIKRKSLTVHTQIKNITPKECAQIVTISMVDGQKQRSVSIKNWWVMQKACANAVITQPITNTKEVKQTETGTAYLKQLRMRRKNEE